MPGIDMPKTGDYIRYRVRDPGKYQRLRTMSWGQGIKAIIGVLSDGKTEVQAVLFNKKTWTKKKVEDWIDEHKDRFDEIFEDALKSVGILGPLNDERFGENFEVSQYGDLLFKSKIDFDRPVEVARVGKYPQGDITEDDLDEIVENYDPDFHEAPLVKDHRHEGGAFGWVKRIWRTGKSLFAKIGDIPTDVKREIQEGRWKKISVGIYPMLKDNQGRELGKALQHISLLGAAIPQIKGMHTFATHHGEYVPYCEINKIEDKQDKGGFDMDEKQFNELLSKKLKEAEKDFTAKVKELQGGFETKFKALEGENKKLKEDLDKSTKQLTQQEEKALETEIHAFCENLKSKGQLPAAWQDAGIEKALKQAALLKMDAMKFSDAEDAKEMNLYQFFRGFLQNIPKVVKFGEIVTDKEDKKVESQFFEVGGDNKRLDIKNQDMAAEAVVLMKEEKISYADALLKISKQKDRR